MSDTTKKSSEMLKCPLCEGCGELEKHVLLERLSEKDLGHKVQSYLSNIVEAESKEEMHGVSTSDSGKHNINSWNLTHFLWRRSPKE